MLKKLHNIPAFLAGDLTEIQEILHPSGNLDSLPYSLALATLPPGKASLPHRLVLSTEVYFILNGSGQLYLDEETFPVETGDTVVIQAHARQWIRNTGNDPLRFLCIVSPPWSSGDEVIETSG